MKVGGQIPWNAIPICETSQISCLMGRRPMKDVLGNHLKDRLFHLVHWLTIILLLRRTSQESINLERKSFLEYSSDTHFSRGEFGRVTYWLHRGETDKTAVNIQARSFMARTLDNGKARQAEGEAKKV